MMKLLGTVLVWGGCGLIGIQNAGQMRRRVLFLEEMGRALELLEHELLLKHTALPELLDLLCDTCKRQTKELFFLCRSELRKENNFTNSWTYALEQTDLSEEDREVLSGLAQVLGQYDAREQGRSLCRLREEVERRTARSREEARNMGRVSCALGLTAGGFLSLSLL